MIGQHIWAVCWGSLIGIFGSLIGLGGAEFRLPVLVGVFNFRTLQAIVINLIISLVTVVFSFIFRTGLVNLDRIVAHTPVILNILAGSLIGSYVGVHFATNINERALHRIVVALLISLSAVLIGHDFIFQNQGLHLPTVWRVALGFGAGIVIGMFSSMLGVAGGELIIPTIILLFAVDIKLAGSLSLAFSISTILMGLAKYWGRQRFGELRGQSGFMVAMSLGSIAGALLGSYLLRYAPGSVLYVILGVILLISAIKLARHRAVPVELKKVQNR